MFDLINITKLEGVYTVKGIPHKWQIDTSGDEYILMVSDQVSDLYDGCAFDDIKSAFVALGNYLMEVNA